MGLQCLSFPFSPLVVEMEHVISTRWLSNPNEGRILTFASSILELYMVIYLYKSVKILAFILY